MSVSVKKSFHWKGLNWKVWDDISAQNYFDSSLVTLDTLDNSVHFKAFRKIYYDTIEEDTTRGVHWHVELHAAAFKCTSSLGPIGTFKFVFRVPDFDRYGGNYFIQSIVSPVLYTLSPMNNLDYEYDVPEIYGALVDTLGHINMYVDTTYYRRVIDSIVCDVQDTNKSSKTSYLIHRCDTFWGLEKVTQRIGTYHNTFAWSFSDPDNTGKGVTTSWISIFGSMDSVRKIDSIIVCVQKNVWNGGGINIQEEHSVVMHNSRFFPNTHLYPEFYLWWPNPRIQLHPFLWQGPDTVMSVLEDFSYSPTPIDPRRIKPYIRSVGSERSDLSDSISKVAILLKNGKVYLNIKRSGIVRWSIFTQDGRLLKNAVKSYKNGGRYVIDIGYNKLHKGIYFVKFNYNEIKKNLKFIKF